MPNLTTTAPYHNFNACDEYVCGHRASFHLCPQTIYATIGQTRIQNGTSVTMSMTRELCVFGNQSLSSHLEVTKGYGFWNS
jgi:hypothetical protein